MYLQNNSSSVDHHESAGQWDRELRDGGPVCPDMDANSFAVSSHSHGGSLPHPVLLAQCTKGFLVSN